MGSYDAGKRTVRDWIRANFEKNINILDVGVSDGKWRTLLSDYPNIDGVEIFEPYARNVSGMYRDIFIADIKDFKYDWYDLVIFGDVIEHMHVEDAQKTLEYAKSRCRDMIVAVPFLYVQGEVNGNVHEIHIQWDLTREIFARRYPDFKVLYDAAENYCYYHWSPELPGIES